MKKAISIAVAIIRSDDKILIAKRPQNKAMQGLWEVAGGKINHQETAEDCLIRELQEEINITPYNFELYKIINHDYDEFSLEMHVFNCKYWHGKPSPLEGQQLKWVTAIQMQDYPMPSANYSLKVDLLKE